MPTIKDQQLKTNNLRGVTIVEILVYIGLLSMFMLVLLDVFTAIMGAKLAAAARGPAVVKNSPP